MVDPITKPLKNHSYCNVPIFKPKFKFLFIQIYPSIVTLCENILRMRVYIIEPFPSHESMKYLENIYIQLGMHES